MTPRAAINIYDIPILKDYAGALHLMPPESFADVGIFFIHGLPPIGGKNAHCSQRLIQSKEEIQIEIILNTTAITYLFRPSQGTTLHFENLKTSRQSVCSSRTVFISFWSAFMSLISTNIAPKIAGTLSDVMLDGSMCRLMQPQKDIYVMCIILMHVAGASKSVHLGASALS